LNKRDGKRKKSEPNATPSVKRIAKPRKPNASELGRLAKRRNARWKGELLKRPAMQTSWVVAAVRLLVSTALERFPINPARLVA